LIFSIIYKKLKEEQLKKMTTEMKDKCITQIADMEQQMKDLAFYAR
jgi:hypothetical protein